MTARDGPGLTMGEMSKKYDISMRTLRFYEERGLLSPRRNGPERRYHRKDEAKLRLVIDGRRLGFSLGEIKVISDRQDLGARLPVDAMVDLLDRAEVEGRLRLLEERRRSLDTAIDELRGRLADDRGG